MPYYWLQTCTKMHRAILRTNDRWDVAKPIVSCFGFMGFNRCGIDGKRVLVSTLTECTSIVISIVILAASVLTTTHVHNCEL